MKIIPSPLRQHILGEVSTLCTCWRLERRDGVVYRWTDHDDDLTIDGDLYLSAAHGGFDRSAIESSLGLSAADLELVGFLGGALDKAELSAGLFDYAKIQVFMVNWAEPSMGAIDLRHGLLGEVQTTDTDIFKVELRGLQDPYSQIIGETYSPECRANFCDARCKLPLASYTTSVVVASVTNRRRFSINLDPATVIAAPPGMFNVGVVRFTSGANVGRPMEIKSLLGVSVELKFAMPNLLTVGDTLDLSAGCDQRLSTCKQYGNVQNFRGEPYLPGNTKVFSIIGGQ